MRSKSGRSRSLLAVVVSAALLLAACEGGRDDETDASKTSGSTAAGAGGLVDASACPTDLTTGIDGDTIKLGSSLPQSGIYSAFAAMLKGARAYLEYTNDQGGVEIAGKQYKLELVDKDDEYDVAKTARNVQALINQDQVFALFNVVGTKNNLAIRKTVNDQCVPDLFAATGSPVWGNPEYPWILGTGLVPYPLEAKAFADYLKANKPDAKVAILFANDDFGKAYLDSFTAQVEGTDIEIVGSENYNPDQPSELKSQITTLKGTGADTMLLAATLTACPTALNNMREAGWSPLVYMSGTCTSKTLMALAGDAGDGVLSVAPLLDPADPANDSNPAMALYKEQTAKYEADAELDNGITAYGWTTAALLVELLKSADAADRGAVMNAAREFEASGVGIMLPDQVYATSADDWFLAETFNLVRYDQAKGFFATEQGPIDLSGQTASLTPEDLLNS